MAKKLVVNPSTKRQQSISCHFCSFFSSFIDSHRLYEALNLDQTKKKKKQPAWMCPNSSLKKRVNIQCLPVLVQMRAAVVQHFVFFQRFHIYFRVNFSFDQMERSYCISMLVTVLCQHTVFVRLNFLLLALDMSLHCNRMQ